MAETDHLAPPNYCWKNRRITAPVRKLRCDGHWLLTFWISVETCWHYLFESWASWSFEGKRECIGLVQSVSNCFKQCVCHDLKHGVVWDSMGKAVILTGCSLEALSLKRLGSGNAQFWPLETGCFSYQVKWILRASDYDLFHYYNNTDT